MIPLEHSHNGTGPHAHEENRAEACYQELVPILERHHCMLRAVLQVQADGTVQPVVQVAELNMTVQEESYGSNHHQ